MAKSIDNIPGFGDVDLTKLVARRHPDYISKFDHWELARVSFEGGREWFEHKDGSSVPNLFEFYKEGNQEYEGRKKRTYRANHTKRVIDTINQYLFRTRPRRSKEIPDQIQKFHKDVTGGRRSIDRFMREVDDKMSTYGRMYIAMDRKPDDATQRKNAKMPYAYIVPPQNVLDMGIGEDGLFDWILIAEDSRNEQSLDEGGNIEVRWRLWTRTGWHLIEHEKDAKGKPKKDKYQITEAGEHKLGMVPVIAAADNDASDWSSPALIDDIIYMDRSLVNIGSLLDEILYEQTFSQLVIPTEGLAPGSAEEDQVIAMATSRAFTYSAVTPGAKPDFISPDAVQAEMLLKTMSQLKRDIYAVTGTDNDANSQSQSTGKSYSSGKVRQFDHTQIENILLDKSRALEDIEEQMMEMALLWLGEKDQVEDSWVEYPDTFDIRGLAAELEISSEMNDLEVPMDMMRTQMKKVADKTFTRMSDADRTTLHKTIDNWMPSYIVGREIKERDQDIQLFTAESQGFAMTRGTEAEGKATIDNPEMTDGKFEGRKVKTDRLPGVTKRVEKGISKI